MPVYYGMRRGFCVCLHISVCLKVLLTPNHINLKGYILMIKNSSFLSGLCKKLLVCTVFVAFLMCIHYKSVCDSICIVHMHSFVLPGHYFFVSACQDCEMLEAETKHFEDLEFQQLEKESRLDEEKETHTQQLLRDIADYQRSMVTRKVRAISL